jgi:hypothetical protein
MVMSYSILRACKSGATCEAHCYLVPSAQCMFLYVRKKDTITASVLKMLGSTVQNSVICVNRRPGFVHPWSTWFSHSLFWSMEKSYSCSLNSHWVEIILSPLPALCGCDLQNCLTSSCMTDRIRLPYHFSVHRNWVTQKMETVCYSEVLKHLPTVQCRNPKEHHHLMEQPLWKPENQSRNLLYAPYGQLLGNVMKFNMSLSYSSDHLIGIVFTLTQYFI